MIAFLIALFLFSPAWAKKTPLKSNIKDPASLRDPFKKKILLSKKKQETTEAILVNGQASNFPTLDNTPLAQIRIVGVLLGTHRRAVAKIARGNQLSGESYLLREGMRLGEHGAEIKGILPGGIILVEKVKNIYDEFDFIETVIPISSGI